MIFLELAKKRYSCRKFSDKEVEEEKINKILEAFRIAPTACNYQPQRLLVVRDKENLKKIRFCTPCGWKAPVQILIFFDKDISAKRRDDNLDLGYMDASIATTQMMLEACDLGLESTWIEMIKPEKVRKHFNVPDNYEVFGLLVLGYADDESNPSELHYNKKDISEFVKYEKF